MHDKKLESHKIPRKGGLHVHSICIINLLFEFLGIFGIKSYTANNIAHLWFSHLKLHKWTLMRCEF